MTNEIVGHKSYLALYSESEWGTKPETPVYVHCPADDYAVRFRPENRQATPYIGLRQKKHNRNHRGMVSGALSCSLYGAEAEGSLNISLAEYLCDWAFGNPETLALPSKGAEWAEGPDVANKNHSGLRVNSATLQGSSDAGVVSLALDLMGSTEATLDTAQTIPVDRNKLVEFEFPDITFEIGNVGGSLTEVAIDAFQIQRQNNLQAKYVGSRTPIHITPGLCTETFQFSIVKNAATYDVIRRTLSASAERHLRLTIKGLHSGTLASGDYAVCQINARCAGYVDHEDERSLEALLMQPLQFVVLKPDTANNGLTFTWGIDAIATTTAEPTTTGA